MFLPRFLGGRTFLPHRGFNTSISHRRALTMTSTEDATDMGGRQHIEAENGHAQAEGEFYTRSTVRHIVTTFILAETSDVASTNSDEGFSWPMPQLITSCTYEEKNPDSNTEDGGWTPLTGWQDSEEGSGHTDWNETQPGPVQGTSQSADEHMTAAAEEISLSAEQREAVLRGMQGFRLQYVPPWADDDAEAKIASLVEQLQRTEQQN